MGCGVSTDGGSYELESGKVPPLPAPSAPEVEASPAPPPTPEAATRKKPSGPSPRKKPELQPGSGADGGARPPTAEPEPGLCDGLDQRVRSVVEPLLHSIGERLKEEEPDDPVEFVMAALGHQINSTRAAAGICSTSFKSGERPASTSRDRASPSPSASEIEYDIVAGGISFLLLGV